MDSLTTVSGCWPLAMHTVLVLRYVHFQQGIAAAVSGTHLLSQHCLLVGMDGWARGAWLVGWSDYVT